MDPFLDPEIDPKSIDFGTSKRYLKINFLDIEMDPKLKKKQTKNIVYSSVLQCTLVYSGVL